MPEGILEIGDKAFYNSGIKEIKVKDGTTGNGKGKDAYTGRVGIGAFANCTELKRAKIPGGLDKIFAQAFSNCASLEEIEFMEGVEGIYDVGNIVFSKNAFYGCTGLKRVVLPEGFREIGGSTFSGCTELETINIPDTVESIGKMAFYDCKKLTSITIPDTIAYIGSNAFSDNDAPHAIIYIYYYGSEEEWDALNVIDSNRISKGSITFNYGGITRTSKKVTWTLTKSGRLTIYGTGDWERGTYRAPWLEYTENIKSAVVTSLSGTTDASGMFCGCSNLTKMDLTGFNTSGVTDMNGMFLGAKRLKMLNLNGFDTSKVTNMKEMFAVCLSMRELDLSSFDLSSLQNAEAMFAHCGLSSIVTPRVVRAGMEIELNHIYYDADDTEAHYTKLLRENINRTLKLYDASGLESDLDSVCVDFMGTQMNIAWDETLFSKTASVYNNNLAVASLVLSGACESSSASIEKILVDMGFDNDKGKIDSKYYGTFSPGNPSRTFASMKLGSGKSSRVLIDVTIRGTVLGGGDLLTDLYSAKDGFKGAAENVYNELMEYINKFYSNNMPGDFVFLINGHSLGGATASVLVQKLSEKYPMKNTYVYTFAAARHAIINSSVFTNINTIWYVHDIIPAIAPWNAHIGNGMSFEALQGTQYNYAYWEEIGKYYKILTGKSSLPTENAYFFDNHDVRMYMSYLLARAKSVKETVDYIPSLGKTVYLISVRCPVDVSIYGADDVLLARVVENIVDTSIISDDVVCTVVDDEKYFLILSDSPVTVKMEGNDEGTMEYTVSKLGFSDMKPDEEITFSSVHLERGKAFVSEVGRYEDVSETLLYVINPETGTPTSEVLTDGTEESLIKTYTVTFDSDGGTSVESQTVNENEKAAEPSAPTRDGFTFTGWYLGEALFDFGTPVTSDMTLKAGWKKADGPQDPNGPDKPDAPTDWGDILPGDRPADGRIPADLWIAGIDAGGYEYTGSPIKPEVRVYDGNAMLTEGTDYSLTYRNCTKINDASDASTAPAIIVKGKGNYSGTETATFQIIPVESDVPDGERIPLKKAVVSGVTDRQYSGVPVRQESASLTYQGTPLTENTDYKVRYAGNVKAGKAAILFIGKGRYRGTIKKTFKITKYDLAGDKVSVAQITGAKYARGGSRPLPVVTFGTMRLKNGRDYTLTYKNNKALGTGTAVIRGKGSFTGTKEVNFQIGPQDLSDVDIVVPDAVYSTKGKDCRPKVKVLDADGKALVAGKDYSRDIVYTYADGTPLGDAAPAEGSVLRVIVTAAGSNYTGTGEAEYRITKSSIARAKITVKNPAKENRNEFDYTGSPITLTKDNLTVKAGDTQLTNDQFEILEHTYKNNISRGSASVRIRGLGDYGGTAVVKFRIGTKGFKWFWKLLEKN